MPAMRPASSALLNHPIGIAFDANRNLFVVDYLNFRIRKVAPDGTIMTIATWLRTAGSRHSVRGFISGQLGKKLGLHVKSFQRDGEHVYRLRPNTLYISLEQMMEFFTSWERAFVVCINLIFPVQFALSYHLRWKGSGRSTCQVELLSQRGKVRVRAHPG